MEEKGKTITIKIPSFNVKKNFWKILSIILLIALAGSMYVNLTGKAILPLSGFSTNEIGGKVVNYINENLLRPDIKATLISIDDMGSYYNISIAFRDTSGNILGQDYVFVSKDGKMLFLQAFDITQTQKKQTQITTQQQTQEIPKKDRPDMKVFIMSYCPYGLQAIKALLPVMKLLDGKADISVHYVYYAMHGEKEVYENLRQYCIQKEQKDKFYDYMLCFVQSGDYQKCLNEAKVDVNKLNACMNETDEKYNVTKYYKDRSTWLSGAYPLFLVEKDLNDKYGVGGSPTIIINDKEVSLSRSAEAFKKAICQSFTNPPAECNQTLSTETTAPGIGPLTGGSTSSGSCG